MGAHDKETEPPTANEAKSAEKQKKKWESWGKLRKTQLEKQSYVLGSSNERKYVQLYMAVVFNK